MAGVRLHRRRGRRSRLRRGQPAERGSRASRSCCSRRAGRTIPPNVHDASVWYTLLGSDVDWKYFSEPQAGLDGRKTFEPRGKLPGGSSDFYIMMHIRGHPSDYDGWAAGGATGWTYKDCLPYFQKLENQDDDTSPWAGHGGPLPVNNAGKHDPNPTSRAFIDACLELGYPGTEDFNGPDMEGAGWHHINVVDGKRFAAYRAYLEPALSRPNLTFETDALATKLIIEDGRCTGVEYRKGSRTHRAHTHKAGEVIVSGGAIESPKLLLLSGIGDAKELKALGIEPTVDLPGVGKNFHNHVLTGVIHESPQPVPPGKQNLSESAMFVKSDPAETGPDLQIAFVHVPFNIIVGQGHPNSISILPGVVRPQSRGSVKLASADPAVPPLVDPNYLGDPSDLEKLVEAVKIARAHLRDQGVRAVGRRRADAGRRPEDGRRAARVRQGHRRLVPPPGGLLQDGHRRPRGRRPGAPGPRREGLRVADASVMPVVPSGNCHAGILMIAERLADWLKAGSTASAAASGSKS